MFDADPDRPGTETQQNGSDDIRLTWQISPKNKLSVYYNYAPRNTDHWTLVQHDPARCVATCRTCRSTISRPLTFRSTI